MTEKGGLRVSPDGQNKDPFSLAWWDFTPKSLCESLYELEYM